MFDVCSIYELMQKQILRTFIKRTVRDSVNVCITIYVHVFLLYKAYACYNYFFSNKLEKALKTLYLTNTAPYFHRSAHFETL